MFHNIPITTKAMPILEITVSVIAFLAVVYMKLVQNQQVQLYACEQ